MKLIHQLARETGVPIGTIRFYEKMGMFTGVKKQETKSNNYTYYTAEVVEKISFIKDAKSVGFSLSEIKEVIDAWYNNTLARERKIEVLQGKIRQTEAKIKELRAVRKQLQECLAEVEG